MDFDLIFRRARVAGREDRLLDLGVKDGRFLAIETSLEGAGPEEVLDGRLVVPGFVETHIHLDKSGIMGRCDCGLGTLAEAVAEVARAKRAFDEADVYGRAEATLEMAVLQGTMRMRTHVEADPRIGLTSVRALERLRRDYAWAIDIELCIFPQEGLVDDPGCEAVLVEGLEAGCDVLGGAPYMDRDPHAQIARLFDLARRFDRDIDLHLDFSLDPAQLDVDEVCRKTDEYGWGGRVAVGHMTKLSSLPPVQLEAAAKRMRDAGVAVTVLPATDLFLTGREHAYAIPRGVAPAHRLADLGVTCALSTNNVLNPFTPYGDCSLIRMANLFANVAQTGTPAGLAACLDMVTTRAAALMNLDDYGIEPGMPADLVVLDCASRAEAVARVSVPLTGFKAGRRTFTRPSPTLHRPI